MRNDSRWRSMLGWIVAFLVLAGAAELLPSARAEDWKGTPEASEFDAGAMAGLGILDGTAGFSLMGSASKKIVHQGFVSDLNDSVSIEAEAGPLFVSGSTAFAYGLHLRWDFQKDSQWTLFALGGLGGDITGAALGSRFELYPRFGLGAFYRLPGNFDLRAEVSHELIALGVRFPLF